MCLASSLMPHTHFIWSATWVCGCAAMMSVSARMTVSGVLSSCDASAMNCVCWSQARLTGRVMRWASNMLTKVTATSVSAKTARIPITVARIEERNAPASAKAMTSSPSLLEWMHQKRPRSV